MANIEKIIADTFLEMAQGLETGSFGLLRETVEGFLDEFFITTFKLDADAAVLFQIQLAVSSGVEVCNQIFQHLAAL